MKISKVCRSILAAVGMFSVFIFTAGRTVFACDCAMPGKPKEELQRADAVFVGEVIGSKTENGSRIFEFKVERFWKGAITKVVSVGSEVGNCRYIFGVGEKYIVYARGKETLLTSICTRTKNLGAASEDLKDLGEGERPK
jgi:hypothetical protein